MTEHYGSDFITISDEDGQEFELEVLTELEYNGFTYLAVIPAGLEEDEAEDSLVLSLGLARRADTTAMTVTLIATTTSKESAIESVRFICNFFWF